MFASKKSVAVASQKYRKNVSLCAAKMDCVKAHRVRL